MLLTSPRLQNVFGDKSSLVIRALLREPNRHWTCRQLAAEGVSLGLVSAVLHDLENAGFVERQASGRFSYARLLTPEKLLTAWTQSYRFDKNPQAQFYSSAPQLLSKMRDYFVAEAIPYALTLFSGANLIAPYVVDRSLYFYLGIPEKEAEAILWSIQAKFMLIPPKAGANVYFAVPVYKSSVFKDAQTIGGFKVASNLQLYLDLANYPREGAEQAKWLKDRLEQNGAPLIGA